MPTPLELRFNEEMKSLYDRTVKATKGKYRPSDFRNMVARQGGVITARQLLDGKDNTSGFSDLFRRGHLELSLEAIVLQPGWRDLFTPQQLETARRRLKDVNYNLHSPSESESDSPVASGSTFLFSWNPAIWSWDKFDEMRQRWLNDPRTTEDWSSGTNKSIPGDAPFFIVKQGELPRGIIGSGHTASGWSRGPRWDGSGEVYNYNKLRFEHLVDPRQHCLSVDNLQDLSTTLWKSPSSGITIPPKIADELRVRWDRFLQGIGEPLGSSNSVSHSLQDSVADDEYVPSDQDSRIVALKQIKIRRGQQSFREQMIGIYGGKCAISGCDVLDVLEAAHIRPYIGQPDHHAANGLLLRADLHTLFDLSLLGIDPTTLTVKLHPSLLASEYQVLQDRRLRDAKVSPSTEALWRRWREFQDRAL